MWTLKQTNNIRVRLFLFKKDVRQVSHHFRKEEKHSANNVLKPFTENNKPSFHTPLKCVHTIHYILTTCSFRVAYISWGVVTSNLSLIGALKYRDLFYCWYKLFTFGRKGFIDCHKIEKTSKCKLQKWTERIVKNHWYKTLT